MQENLTSNVLPIQKHEETAEIEDCTTLLEKVTPRRRGRPKKVFEASLVGELNSGLNA